MTLQVDVDDGVPLLLGHVDEDAVPQDAGVVDQHVQVAERFHGAVDQALPAFPVGHVVGVGDGFAAHALDLVGHLLGRRAVVAAAVHRPTEVVDHDLGALAGEEQCVFPADTPTGPSDDGNPTFERAHDNLLVSRSFCGRHPSCGGHGWPLPRRTTLAAERSRAGLAGRRSPMCAGPDGPKRTISR